MVIACGQNNQKVFEGTWIMKNGSPLKMILSGTEATLIYDAEHSTSATFVYEEDDKIILSLAGGDDLILIYNKSSKELVDEDTGKFILIKEENKNRKKAANNIPKISSKKEGNDWSFQDMLQYLESVLPDFEYETTDYGIFLGPAVYFAWSSSYDEVYLQSRNSEGEARNEADKAMLEADYAFSWGRFYFVSGDEDDIDFLKKYFPK
jgi:hypothetical protein